MYHNREIQKNRYIALCCSWLAIFSAYASVLCVSPILDVITQEFELTASRAGLLFGAPIITLGLVAFWGGTLGDRLGPRRTAGIGAVILSVSAFLRGISPNFVVLLLLNLSVGIGWGLVFPNLPKLVKLWFPAKMLGTATGIYSTGVFAGSTLALAITIPVISPLVGSWRGVYFVWGSIALVITLIWWFLAREPDSSFDGNMSSMNVAKGSIKVIFWNIHIWIVAIFFALAANATFYIIMGWFPTFFVQKGLTENTAGFLTSLVTITALPAVFLVPFASDRVGLRKPFLWISCLLAAIAFIGILYTPVILDAVLMGLLGITLTTTYVMSLFLPTELVNPVHAGTATGLVISVGYIGGALGPLFVGYLKDLTGTLLISIVMLGIIMIISMILAFFVPETGWRKKATIES
jgi:CP family cyanate transporter-like MFS transporter